MKTATAIQEAISNTSLGQPFTTKEFLRYGNRAAVDQALSRLVASGEIVRIRRGVFVRPEHNRFLGEVLPEPYEVATVIAKSSGAVIAVNPAEAARRLELTTQVPTRPVYFTSGPNSRFRLGRLEVEMKHVSPRKLALAGRRSGLAILALRYLGKELVNHETIQSIENKMSPEEFSEFEQSLSSMPTWMADKVQGYSRTRLPAT